MSIIKRLFGGNWGNAGGLEELAPNSIKEAVKQSTAKGAYKRDFTGKSLGETQRMFTLMVAELIQYAYRMGYEITLGDAYRDPRVHGHVGEKKSYSSANSVHKERLAIDLNLFLNGKYLTATEDHRELGEYWEAMGGSWGGRFNDGNHYSIEWKGRK